MTVEQFKGIRNLKLRSRILNIKLNVLNRDTDTTWRDKFLFCM